MGAAMSDFLEQYKSIQPTYQTFSRSLELLLSTLLMADKVHVHFTESRAKSIDSFAEKLSRPDKKYTDPLNQMPDLAGVRVVLYYMDDVPRVGEIIAREFEVIEKESSHQSTGFPADQFGYISMHYVIQLNALRDRLSEWKSYAGMHAEIQVRTVLQHSWAAVSHALQYKQEGDVPFELRRKLFRLAGIFELADEEFVVIRNAAIENKRYVKQAFEQDPSALRLDADSVREFLRSWARFGNIKDAMSNIGVRFGVNAHPEDDGVERPEYIGEFVGHCERIGISTIQDLSAVMDLDFTSFVENLKDEMPWVMSDEFLLLILLIAAKAKEFDVPDLTRYGWDEDIAGMLIEVAHSSSRRAQ